MSASEDPPVRLIEWTGERCVPWVQDAAMLYEHFHRYLWAARLAAGRRVLDLGSGEGYGAALLAATAAEVLGVDVDEHAVEHARLNHRRENLAFEAASALDLSRLESRSFGVVVAFEMVEHLVDHDRMMAEVARVLADDGILIVSTPDRDHYSAATGQANSFHEHELSHAEFRALLSTRYSNVEMYGQRTITGSYLSALERAGTRGTTAGHDFFVAPGEGGLAEIEEPAPLFCVAVASNAELPPVGGSSTLADYSLELLHQTARAHAVAVAERDSLLADANEQLSLKREEVIEVGGRLAAVEAQLLAMGDRLREEERFRLRMESSTSWQAFQRLRALLYGAIGEDSRAGRALKSLLRAVGRGFVRSP
ncbi:MAG TPA: class I SAM-dependent methyltransferase [Solirubrobacteraceae bacterium]|nr:class I SAM-dependent methyltransferase [Solirubrobacteraceae bacterium]